MMDLKTVDVRTAHRYVAKGAAEAKRYEEHLKSLPDLTDESDFVDYETMFREEQERVAQETEAEAAAEAAAVEAAAIVEIPEPPPGPQKATVAPADVAPSAVAQVPTAPKSTPPGEY